MRRRDFLATSGGTLLFALHPPALNALSAPEVAPAPKRGLRIAVDPRSGPATLKAVQFLLEAIPSHPLLMLMAAGDKPKPVDTAKLLTQPLELAYNHLILIGRPDDPLIAAAWQHEALFSEPGHMYAFGFGGFKGDIGYVESDRNPFLHAINIKSAPFETEVVTLTGTTDEGIALAVRSFLQRGLVNGLTAREGWTRTETTLLDRDPLSPTFTLPAAAADKIGDYTRIGVMQAAEDEYRGVLQDTGAEPQQIWRAKYYKVGAWDGKGAITAFDAYSNGLHRRAYGSTLWLAQFSNAEQAAAAAPKIAATAKLEREGNRWTGLQPAYANGTYPGEKKSSGPLTLWQKADWVAMSTLDMPAAGAAS
jgi:hypothetical protein